MFLGHFQLNSKIVACKFVEKREILLNSTNFKLLVFYTEK